MLAASTDDHHIEEEGGGGGGGGGGGDSELAPGALALHVLGVYVTHSLTHPITRSWQQSGSSLALNHENNYMTNC